MLPAYCTNAHAGESVADIWADIQEYACAIKEGLGWKQLGLDLRLGAQAIQELHADKSLCQQLSDNIHRSGLVVTTINAFPLLPFQQAVVKELAYTPDWLTEERLRLSTQLIESAAILSRGKDITLSTVPGSFKPWGSGVERHRAIAKQLVLWAVAAEQYDHEHGVRVQLALEPEPWCLLENSREVVAFWQGPLREAWEAIGNDSAADYLGICWDTCHASLAFEETEAAFQRFDNAGVRIIKCQVSAAPSINPRNTALLAALRALDEPRFLHQAVLRSPAGSQWKIVDLPCLDNALNHLPQANILRSHFHVPLYWGENDPIPTTIAETCAQVAACLDRGLNIFSVETYTWSILAGQPADVRSGLMQELLVLQAMLASTPD